MKRLTLHSVPAVLVLSWFWSVGAYAQITPIGDAYTNTASSTTNYGSKPTLGVDAASQITYIQFDLSSIPSGASISQATLKLYVNSVTTAGSFNVNYINGSWLESTINASNAPPQGGTIVSGVALTTAQKNEYLLINVTPAVQAWINGSQTNDGLALVANSEFNATFDSKENTGTSHAPELDIVYAAIGGVNTASGSGLMGGGTSGTLNLSLTNTCSANQVLQWSGSAWQCAAVATGTITGVNPGTDLTGGGTSGIVTLNVDTTKIPLLAAANNFTGNQTVNGNLSATGAVTGSSFQIGSNLFAFGSLASFNAFLGFAGNTTTTGTSDTAIGSYALAANTTGSSNSAIGSFALDNNTTGFDNTATGYGGLAFNTTGIGDTAGGAYALYSNTTGSSNTASGIEALYANTTGGYNSADGAYALLSNNTGHDNTANGYSALLSNTGGILNTADGSGALSKNTTGAQNTAVGWGALYAGTTGYNNSAYGSDSGNTLDSSDITGANNTLLGANTELSTGTLTNATAIGAQAEAAASNSLVLGSIKGVNNATASTNVGIGTTTPAATLDVHGTGNFTGLITFAPGQTFPGSGTVTNVASGSGLTGGPITGSGTLSIATGGVSNAMLASPSLTINPGTALTGGGAVSLGGSTTLNLDTSKVPLLAAANTFTANQQVSGNLSATGTITGSSYQIGSNLFAYGVYTFDTAYLGFAGNTSTTGLENTGVGAGALYSNGNGSYNTASGTGALHSNVTGTFNTAAGVGALFSNSIGQSNTATGGLVLSSNSSGSFNTADGYEALNANVGGIDNTAAGFAALVYSTGSYNTALGAVAGNPTNSQATTGLNNTYVGYQTNSGTQLALNNATAIGADAQVTASNAMVLGSISGVNSCTPANSCADTMVGIGITAPTALLHIGNSGGTSFTSYLRIEGPAKSASGIPAFSLGGFGDFGIDSYGHPNRRFVVKESGFVGIGTESPTHPLQMADGSYEGSGQWVGSSDRNLKEGFKPLDGKALLDTLAAIPITSWNYKSEARSIRHLGPMAQDFYAAFRLGLDDKHIGTLDEGGVALAAIQQLYRDSLKKDSAIRSLQDQIESQAAQIEAQQAQMARLVSQVKMIRAVLRSSTGYAQEHTVAARMSKRCP